MQRSFLALVLLLLGAAGCPSTIGQVDLVRTDRHGDLSAHPPPDAGIAITPSDVVSVRLDSLFVRHMREIGTGELLVYMEIFDRQPDDRERLVKTLYQTVSQPEGFLINERNRLGYGPIAYSGHALRIRLIVVELDKNENAVMSEILHTAARVGAAAQPQFAVAAGVVTTVGDLLLKLNKDDRELDFGFTLYPNTVPNVNDHSLLRTGGQVLIKTEASVRSLPWQAQVESTSGDAIEATVEDYATLYAYVPDRFGRFSPEEPENLRQRGSITPLSALRIIDGQLWLEAVAFVHDQEGEILAARRHCDPEPPPGQTYCVEEPLPAGFEIRHSRVGGSMLTELVPPEGDPFRLGARAPYREKTHAVLTIARGGKAVDRSLLEEISTSDDAQIRELLQAPVTAETLKEKIAELGDRLVKIATHRRVVSEVNENLSDEERKKGSYPVSFLSRLRTPAKDNQSHNEAIIEIVQGIVTGFPYTTTDAGVDAKVGEMKKRVAANFCPKADGTFSYNADAKTACPKPAGSSSAARGTSPPASGSAFPPT